MIRLWGRNTSSNVMKVIWLLEELGISYERVDAGGVFGGTSTDAYRAMNPLGLVPSLEDGAFTLFESNAIQRYICNAYAPGSTLYPGDSRARAVVEAWMDFQQTALNPPQSVVFVGLIRTAPENRDQAAISAAIKQAAGIWAVLDKVLAEKPYIYGNDLTLADITFGPHVHRWFNMPFSPPPAPNLWSWYQRLLSCKAYTVHCARTVI
jgi:glutathione S-transferase